MGQKIRIVAGDVAVTAELNDTATAAAIAAALPLRAAANRWGQEIYFSIPVQQPSSEDARADMEVGELGYWPPGTAFCIFFGPTPASVDDQPRAASPVNPIGRLIDEPAPLNAVPDGAEITVEAE